jgi:hypothetical protein
MPESLTPLQRYMSRHTTPFNRVLHMLGVPATFVGLGLAIAVSPALGVALIALGFLLQYIGHVSEGSPMGELQLLQRIWRGNGKTRGYREER